MARKSSIYLAAFFLLLAALAVAVTLFVTRIQRSMDNAYAVWNVAGMVIGHMESHDG